MFVGGFDDDRLERFEYEAACEIVVIPVFGSIAILGTDTVKLLQPLRVVRKKISNQFSIY